MRFLQAFGWMFGAAVGVFAVLGILTVVFERTERPKTGPRYEHEWRAYNALRDQGYSDREARNAAGAVHQLCVQARGSDC